MDSMIRNTLIMNISILLHSFSAQFNYITVPPYIQLFNILTTLWLITVQFCVMTSGGMDLAQQHLHTVLPPRLLTYACDI